MLVVITVVAGIVVGAVSALLAEALMAHRRMEEPACPYCQAPYGRFQWSATVAFLMARIHCRECGKPFRLPRLVGELLLAATWGLLAARYGFTPRALVAMLAAIPLQMVTVTDLEAKLIPNRILLPAALAMAAVGVLYGPAVPGIAGWTWSNGLVGGLIGFGVFGVLGMIGVALLGEGALGAGDVKLAAYIGLVVGYPWAVAALILAMLFGGVGGFLVLLVRRGSLKTAIPYGPFLVLGALATMIWGVDIVRWFMG